MDGSEHVETVIIGGGQAGLATGYQLATRGLPFVILDANERIGDGWRKRCTASAPDSRKRPSTKPKSAARNCCSEIVGASWESDS